MSLWSKPDNAEVARTLSAVGEPALRRLFFQELENPEWLTPLASLGTFADPGIVETDDGYTAWPWPEGDYLQRMASQLPAEVTALAKTLATSRNPWVQRMLVEIAASLPVDNLVQLVPGIAELMEGGPDRVDHSKVAFLIEQLLDNEKRGEARKLLTALFRPVQGGEEEMAFGSRPRISSALDDYWYRELLERLVSRIVTMGLDGLKLVAGWLLEATEIRSSGRSDDRFSIWRPSIAAHAQNTGLYGIDDALIDAVRDLGMDVTRLDGTREAIDFLNRRRQMLLRRIGVEVAATALEDHDQIILVAGNEMLLDPSLLDIDARPEYAHLARALVPRLSAEQSEQWSRFVLGGEWLPTEEELRQIVAWRDGDPQSVSSEQIEEQRRRLTHRLLSSIATVLPSELAAEFASLESQFGELAHPEFSSYMESFTGPTSPSSVEEIAAMTAAQLASHLANWTPGASHQFGPSVDGLARVVESVVAAEPARLEELLDQLSGLRPAYARAIVAGWAQAAKSGYKPSPRVWRELARLASHELNQSVPDEEISFEDDPRWQLVHRALADLATAVAELDADINQIAFAWDVLRPLTSHPDPSIEHEERYGGTNMDPLTLSLNTVRPVALRGVLRLVGGIAEDDGEQAAALRAEFLGQLALHSDPALDPSLAVAAVFGEALGRIWNVDQTWVEARREDLMLSIASSDPVKRGWADVVVSVALRVYQPGIAVLQMMQPALEIIFTNQYGQHEHVEGWRDHRSTVQTAIWHVVWTMAQGAIGSDDPLVTAIFGGAVDVEHLSEALGHFGWQLMHLVGDGDQPRPPEEFLGRARGLTESRLAAARNGTGEFNEFSHFYWWVRSDAFEVEWWLPILDEVTEAGVQLDKTFIGEPLEQAALRHPAMTIAVFGRLIGQTDYWEKYDLLQHAAKIIARALDSDSDAAIEEARSLMDRFAREGHLDVVDQIERLSRTTDAQGRQ